MVRSGRPTAAREVPLFSDRCPASAGHAIQRPATGKDRGEQEGTPARDGWFRAGDLSVFDDLDGLFLAPRAFEGALIVVWRSGSILTSHI